MRLGLGGGRPSGSYAAPGLFGGGMTPGVRALLFATCGAFLFQALAPVLLGPGYVRAVFGLRLRTFMDGCVWQLVTYMFVHADIWHLLINMLGLFFMGPETERALGTRRFVALYAACGLIGGAAWLLISARSGALCVGASGAVLGVLGAFAAVFPDRQITLLLFFVLPVAMKARTLAAGFAAFTLIALVMGGGSVAHASHLAGGVAGFVYGLRAARRLPFDAFGVGPRPFAPGAGWLRRLRERLAARRRTPTEDEVNEVLDRLAANGFGSLSRRDRRVLEEASRAAAAREAARRWR